VVAANASDALLLIAVRIAVRMGLVVGYDVMYYMYTVWFYVCAKIRVF